MECIFGKDYSTAEIVASQSLKDRESRKDKEKQARKEERRRKRKEEKKKAAAAAAAAQSGETIE